LAYKHKLASMDACPLSGLLGSCTHITCVCKTHKNPFMRRHNITCQLAHATIRTAFKGGGTICSPRDLKLVSMDAKTKHQTTDEDIYDFNTLFPHAQYDNPSPLPPYAPKESPSRCVHRHKDSPHARRGSEVRRRRGGLPAHTGLGPPIRRS
jgi:hypothetical protein